MNNSVECANNIFTVALYIYINVIRGSTCAALTLRLYCAGRWKARERERESAAERVALYTQGCSPPTAAVAREKTIRHTLNF